MRKLFETLRLISKASLLLVILVVSWAFINIVSLLKGKNDAEPKNQHNPFSANIAHADAPSDGPPTCPHVALWDGREFRIENDFLLGRPKGRFTDYATLKSLYESGVAGPDLLKFTQTPRRPAGRIALQLQEFEEEETFIDCLKLLRVVHKKDTEVIPDSTFENFYVWQRDELQKDTHLPQSSIVNGQEDISAYFADKNWLFNKRAEDIEKLFQRKNTIDFAFAGLKKSGGAHLIIKSQFRDWMIGSEMGGVASALSFSFKSLLKTRHAKQFAMLLVVGIFLVLQRKLPGSVLALVPFIIGSGSMSAGDHSIIFSYKDVHGSFKRITINRPRDWRESIEAIQLPKDAVREDGTAVIRAAFTKKHKLNFVGLIQGAESKKYDKETLLVTKAAHSRVGDITDVISNRNSQYGHMIPGDTVDLEFQDPEIDIASEEKETYLLQSFGFYSALREQSLQLAGNWRDKISDEAKRHYNGLTALRDYN